MFNKQEWLEDLFFCSLFHIVTLFLHLIYIDYSHFSNDGDKESVSQTAGVGLEDVDRSH